MFFLHLDFMQVRNRGKEETLVESIVKIVESIID